MNIQKIGHCCLVIRTNGVTILTDPGSFSTAQDKETGIDIVLITHEHGDHFHIDSVKKIIANNPNAKVITNTSVGKLLAAEGIAFEVVAEGGKSDAHGALIEGYGSLHAPIYDGWGQVENTGYFIDGKLFYPGDAFVDPKRAVDILALPVAGPWMKISEAMDYCIKLKPRVAFPVHDGILKHPGMMNRLPEKVLPENGIQFVAMTEGEAKDF